MDVATPTSDCLELVNDLLLPVIMKGKTKHTLSHQEVGGIQCIFICPLECCLMVSRPADFDKF